MDRRARKTYGGLLGLQGAVTFSDAVMPLALPWIAYDLSRSLPLMAVLYVVESLVPLVLGIGITPWVSRVGPIRALSASQWGRALMLTGVLALSFSGWRALLWVWLFASAGVIGLSSVMGEASLRAAIPVGGIASTTYVGGLERVGALVRLTALPIAGVALVAFGARGILLLLLMLAMASGAYASVLPAAHTEHAMPARAVRATAGLRRLWQLGPIRSLALQAMVGNFGNTLVMSTLLFYLRASLHLSAAGVSLTFAAIALGSFLGTFTVMPLLRRWRRGTLYPLFLTGGLVGLVLLQIRQPWAPAVGEAIVGLCDTAWVVMSTGLRLQLIPEGERTQVLTASRLLSNAIVPVAGIVVAVCGPLAGIPVLFLAAAAAKAAEVLVASGTDIRRIDAGYCCAAGSA